MSGIKKTLKKVFTKKVLKAVAIGAAIYFAWGAASGAFAEPTAGMTANIGEKGFSAFADTAIGEGITTGTGAALEASVAETIGTTALAPTVAAPVATGAGIDLSLAGAGAGITAPAATTPGIVDSAMGFMKTSPAATMMIGQGVAGAMQASAEEKAQAREDEYRRSRGLMGFDISGEYGGRRPGIVSAQMPAPQTTAQAVTGPTVAAPMQQQVRPIQRKNLPTLNRQGLIAKQRV